MNMAEETPETFQSKTPQGARAPELTPHQKMEVENLVEGSGWSPRAAEDRVLGAQSPMRPPQSAALSRQTPEKTTPPTSPVRGSYQKHAAGMHPDEVERQNEELKGGWPSEDQKTPKAREMLEKLTPKPPLD